MIKLEDDGLKDNLPDDFFVVMDQNIATEEVSEISGILVGKLDRNEKSKMMRLEDNILKQVKGQDVAV